MPLEGVVHLLVQSVGRLCQTVSELALRPFSRKSQKIQGTENRFTYIYACCVCILARDFNTFSEIVEGAHALQFFRFFLEDMASVPF